VGEHVPLDMSGLSACRASSAMATEQMQKAPIAKARRRMLGLLRPARPI
jgi:hypothetical protein